MIKYFCDRCGKDCESYALLLINPSMWGEVSLNYDGKSEHKIHLCPTCYTKFERFIEKQQIIDADEL